MIIDIHTHMFPPKIAPSALQFMQSNCHTALFSDGTAEGLSACEKRAGVNLAVVQPVATNPEKVSHINDAAIEANKHTKETGILSFGGMHPACPYWEKELERIKEAGIAGIKLHPAYIAVDIDDPRSVAVLWKCRDLGLIVLIHSGWDVGIPGAEEALPDKIRRALDKTGPLRLIAGHMGGWKCWKEGQNLLAETGIYIDTAFAFGEMVPAPGSCVWSREDLRLLDTEGFCGLMDAYGTGYVLFGTDSPWADPGTEIEKIRQLPLPQEDISRILGINAEELLSSAGICFKD